MVDRRPDGSLVQRAADLIHADPPVPREPLMTRWCGGDMHDDCDGRLLYMSGPVRSRPCECSCHTPDTTKPPPVTAR